MVDRRPLDLLIEAVELDSKIYTYVPKIDNRKLVYRLQIYSKKAITKLLNYIYPFLLVKQEQAKLLKEMLLLESTAIIRQPYHQKMSVLNS